MKNSNTEISNKVERVADRELLYMVEVLKAEGDDNPILNEAILKYGWKDLRGEGDGLVCAYESDAIMRDRDGTPFIVFDWLENN